MEPWLYTETVFNILLFLTQFYDDHEKPKCVTVVVFILTEQTMTNNDVRLDVITLKVVRLSRNFVILRSFPRPERRHCQLPKPQSASSRTITN